MTVRERLQEVIDALPEHRQREVLNFAEFLSLHEDHEAWQRFGQEQFARCYGPGEPEYTLDDLKPEPNS